jgi:Terminase-like family.
MAKYARYPNQRVLYVAPTYRQAKMVIWDQLKAELIQRKWVKKINESDLTITLVNNSNIYVRSSDNYDSLRGGKYHFIVLDECGDISPETWFNVLRATLSDTLGDALFIGSPRGRNWFYDLWLMGHNTADWASFQYTTLDGGNVPASEILAARRDLDERTFAAEYLAQFNTDGNIIFYSFTEDNIKPWPGFTDQNTPVHIGMDFNVNPMTALAATKSATGLHVFDQIEIYSSNTYEMVAELRRRWPTRTCLIYPDASGAKRTTNSSGISDHIILSNAGFKLVVNNINPPVSEAIASVNSLLCNSQGERRLLIDPSCTGVRETLIKWSYKTDTRQPDKNSGLDHRADALRYLVHSLFPLKLLPQGMPGAKPHKHSVRGAGRIVG